MAVVQGFKGFGLTWPEEPALIMVLLNMGFLEPSQEQTLHLKTDDMQSEE